jgi:hypothetical protein
VTVSFKKPGIRDPYVHSARLRHHVAVTAPVDARPRKFELVPVRSRDARRLREFGPPLGVELPAKHGGADDPRYPSPHNLRYTLGFTLDLVLHVACAAGAFVVLARDGKLSIILVLVAALGTFLGVSIVHRIFAQRVFHTTLGKGLAGLRLIRDDTGSPPTLWSLTKAWLWGTLGVILTVISS